MGPCGFLHGDVTEPGLQEEVAAFHELPFECVVLEVDPPTEPSVQGVGERQSNLNSN